MLSARRRAARIRGGDLERMGAIEEFTRLSHRECEQGMTDQA
jgi:hypothetical protein